MAGAKAGLRQGFVVWSLPISAVLDPSQKTRRIQPKIKKWFVRWAHGPLPALPWPTPHIVLVSKYFICTTALRTSMPRLPMCSGIVGRVSCVWAELGMRVVRPGWAISDSAPGLVCVGVVPCSMPRRLNPIISWWRPSSFHRISIRLSCCGLSFSRASIVCYSPR